MALIITPKPQPPPASCLPLKIEECFLLQVDGARGQVGINPSRTAGHLPAVAPGQSQRDTLSVLDHCWKSFPFGGSELLVLSYISLPRDQDCGEDGLSMTLCHRRGVGKLTVASTKAKYPSE